jgi:putative PEP-CTERM system TPR-repeat lipoprotein
LVRARRIPGALFVAASLCLAAACSQDPQVAMQKAVARGDEHLAAGRLPEAILEYRNAVQADARAGEARVKLADAYVRAGEGGKALEEYVRAADLLPDDIDVKMKAASLQLLAGRFDEGKRLAEAVLQKDSSHLLAQILVANALAGLKDFNQAVAEIEEAIRLDPNRGESYSSLGAFEVQRGNPEAAARAFQRAVELAPDSPIAHLALANFLWVRANWEGAEHELVKAGELAPDDPMVHRALANFYIATNRTPAAEPHLKRVAEISKDPAAAFALADYYAARGNADAARAVLLPLAGTPRTAPLAETKLATIEFGAGQREAAYGRLNRVLEQDTTNLRALLTRASALLEDRKLQEAEAAATAAVEHHKDSAEAHFVLGRVQMARRQTDAAIASFNEVLNRNPRATDAKVALARLHLASGRSETSVTLAQEAVALDPKNFQARLTVVRGLLARKELARAETELVTLMQQYPKAPAVHTLSGLLSGAKGNAVAARSHFERALELDPKSVEAVRGLVAIDVAARRTPDARARVESRVAEDPRNSAVLMLAAQTFAATGDLSRAEGYLRQLLAIDASFLEAYSGLAAIYVKQGRLDAALSEFDELARRQPRPVGALIFAGTILQGQGKTEQARDRFTRALELDPDAAVAANNLAWMYAEAGDRLDAALELAQRAKARLPKSHEVDDTLGFVHYKRNAPAEAIPHFERSVAAAPNNPVYQYHLGLARAKSGDTSGARSAFDRAVALRPGYAEAVDARQTLASTGASR